MAANPTEAIFTVKPVETTLVTPEEPTDDRTANPTQYYGQKPNSRYAAFYVMLAVTVAADVIAVVLKIKSLICFYLFEDEKV